MAMVNMNNLLNMKDSRWLQLEVCREFQRNKCSRPDTECKFAHPPVNVEVQNGRVTACYDSIKGRCNREKPPCKYFHPPLHLKDQLLINGRNHLALKNALMQQMGMGPGQSVVAGQVPTVATNPYLGVTNSYNPYFPTGPLVSLVSDPSGAQVMSPMSPLGVPQQAVIQQKSYPGMVTYKRPADKGGVSVYPQTNNASAAAYQHLMQLQQQPFVPVSSSSIQHHHQIQAATTTSPVKVTSSASSDGNITQADTTELLDGPVLKKLKPEVVEDGDSHEDANGVGSGEGCEESKDESSVLLKRMRANAGGTPPQATLNSNVVSSATGTAPAVVVNNNAAYAVAAQNYHSALAAMTYTGASLQANATKGQAASIPAAAVQATIQPQLQYPTATLQQQQTQQQQLLQQYQQAVAAAAFASHGFHQQQSGTAAAAQLTGQQLSSGFPLAMNPYFAALPQLAAAQRAQLLQQQTAAASVAGAFSQVPTLGGAGTAGFNPFGLHLGAAPGLTAANIQQFQQSQQQQHALLAAAYGQFTRAPVPVVSAAPSLTQQLYIGNPVTQGGATPLQTAVGVKRMRPG